MKILHRYVLKEHLGPLVFSLSALTSLLLLNYIGKNFGNLVGKGLPWTVIGEFFGLSVPFTLALTMPMSVLVATLYAFSRLASENEITALRANGVSFSSVLEPVLWGAAIVAVFMVIFNDQILPRANHQLAVLQADIAQKKPTFALREQVINEVSPGRLYLRAGHIDTENANRMRDVVIYDLGDPTRRRTIYADSGSLAMSRNRNDLEMTLYDGFLQDVPTAQPVQLQRLFFGVELIRVRGVGNQFVESKPGASKSNREMSVCEMQREVEKANRDYLAAVRDRRSVIVAARKAGIKLDAKLRNDAPDMPPSFTLGGAYCSLLAAFGVKTVSAQRPMPRPQGVVDGQLAPPPSSGLSTAPDMVPSTLAAAQLRLDDARATRASYDVEINKKFALAVAPFVLILLGAPIALRFPRGGVGLTIGVSLVAFALYYIGLIAGASLGQRGIVPPFVAMWIVNIIFAVVGLLLLARMNREGGTSRGGDADEMIEAARTWLTGVLRRAASAGPAARA